MVYIVSWSDNHVAVTANNVLLELPIRKFAERIFSSFFSNVTQYFNTDKAFKATACKIVEISLNLNSTSKLDNQTDKIACLIKPKYFVNYQSLYHVFFSLFSQFFLSTFHLLELIARNLRKADNRFNIIMLIFPLNVNEFSFSCFSSFKYRKYLYFLVLYSKYKNL